jgi:hypothetical protein
MIEPQLNSLNSVRGSVVQIQFSCARAVGQLKRLWQCSLMGTGVRTDFAHCWRSCLIVLLQLRIFWDRGSGGDRVSQTDDMGAVGA